MRTIWRGTISFGLVTVPVGVVVAQDQGRLPMHRVSRSSGARVRQRRWDPVEERELRHEETVSGYEVAPGHMATVDPATLRALRTGPVPPPPAPPARPAPDPAAPPPPGPRGDVPPPAGAAPAADPAEPGWAAVAARAASAAPVWDDDGGDDEEEDAPVEAPAPPAGSATPPHGDPLLDRRAPDPQTIAVDSFTALDAVPPELFDRAYWLAPGRNGERPYRLLHAALGEAGQAAVCRVVLRERERLALIRAADGLLVLHTLFWPEDLRAADRDRIAGAVSATPLAAEEVALARQLIGHLEREWDATEHRDAARARLRAHLAAQAPGAVPAPPAPEAAPVADLMAALRASLARARGEDAPDAAAGGPG